MKMNWRTRTLFLFIIAVSSFTTLLMLQDFKEAAERSQIFSSQRSIRVRSMSILSSLPDKDLWRQSALHRLTLFGVGQERKRNDARKYDVNNNNNDHIMTQGSHNRFSHEIKHDWSMKTNPVKDSVLANAPITYVPNAPVSVVLNAPVPVGPNDPVPVGPNDPVPVVPNAPVPVVPNAPIPVVPNAPVPVVPNAPIPVVPNAPVPVVPNAPVPVVPNAPIPVVPNDPVHVVPNAPIPVVPNDPVHVVPNAPVSSNVPVPVAVDSKNVSTVIESKDIPGPPNADGKKVEGPKNILTADASKNVSVASNVSATEARKDIQNSSNTHTLTAQNGSDEDVCRLLLERQSEHLSPLTTINRRIMVAKPPLTRQQISNVYRQGCGLMPDRAPDGQATWREGAMLYIPKNVTGEKRFGSITVYNADFEPYVPYNHTVFFEGREHPPVPEKDRKIILTRLAGWDDVNSPQKLRACPDLPCLLTTDWKKYYKTASAVTFNGQLVRGRAPKRANPDQVFIMYFYEPLTKPWPAYNHLKNPNNGWTPIFNWTMSYHITSDIIASYGMVRKRPQSLSFKNYTDIVSRKTKKVAWFVSHCRTEGKRENYVAELQKYIHVDIYGACGPLKCRKEVDTTCFSQVGRDYKFYFAFENSMCEDYTTEKLYRIFKSDAIIVSRGNSFNFRSLPDGTYIDTSDFASPRALAEHLLYLDSHDDEYMALLKRKDEFFASYQDYPHYLYNGKWRQLWVKYTWEYIPLCEVCQRIWNLDKYRKSYPNILDWLNERKCKAPKDL